MKKLINQITGFWYLICCASVLALQSLSIIFSSYKKREEFRAYINKHTHDSCTKILNIVKANYSIEYTCPIIHSPQHAYIFMCNHRSLFDIPLIFATLDGTIRPITKKELFSIPLLGRAMLKGECVPVDRRDPKSIEFMRIAREKLNNGVSLLFFPEGTRSPTNELLPFKTGGFRLARETATKIIPIAAVNTNAILPKKTMTLSRNETIVLRVGAPVDPAAFTGEHAQRDFIHHVRSIIDNLLKVPLK